MKNLADKIKLLVEDIERMNDYDKAAAIERFVLLEVGHAYSIHHLTATDLAQIHADACRISTSIPRELEIDKQRIINSTSHTQALSYSEAFYAFLRRNGLISALVGFRGRKL